MVEATTLQLHQYSAKQLYRSAITSNITLIFGATLVSAYFYNFTGSVIIIWLIGICLVAAARIYTSKLYHKDAADNYHNRPALNWLYLHRNLTFIMGCACVSLLALLPEDLTTAQISILYVVFFASMAGSITTLPVYIPSFYAFNIPTFAALISYVLFMHSGLSENAVFISITTVIYMAFITVTGQLLSRRYQQNFELITENEHLIDKLHSEIIQKELAQDELEDSHNQLEQIVEKRTKELADINEILVDEINERRRIEHNLKHIAHHDALTNLPNRLLLDARLNHAIDRAKRSQQQVAVMFIDLDHFKTINDSLGHDAGDKLLLTISQRLQNCIREDDTVARLGGDEFIIIIEQVHDIANLHTVLKKIMKATSETVTIDNHDLMVSASIGISIFPDDGKNAEQLMRNADAAMYHVKENGRHQYHFYTRELTSSAYDRVILETDLKQAVEKDQLEVFYQPQVSMQTHQIVSAEALVRWHHPELGILPPKQFLYIAEHSSGLISQIGEAVLLKACRQIVEWRKQGLPIRTVAVNIAGHQIHHTDLVATVKDVLDKTGCHTSWLELEITEDFIIKKTRQSISTLRELRKLGISLAIDDFGTGYSSLSYLKHLPINKLKIDRSFVQDLNDDMEDAALVQAIIAMGRNLNLKLIAEGVENSSHEIFLSAHGCDYAQGYYYSKPVNARDMEQLLIEQQNKVSPIRSTG